MRKLFFVQAAFLMTQIIISDAGPQGSLTITIDDTKDVVLPFVPATGPERPPCDNCGTKWCLNILHNDECYEKVCWDGPGSGCASNMGDVPKCMGILQKGRCYVSACWTKSDGHKDCSGSG